MNAAATLVRQERIIAVVRWGAVFFAGLLITFYSEPRPGLEEATALARPRAYALTGLLALVGLATEVAIRVLRDPHQLRRFGLAVLVADTMVALGFVWVFAFDPFSPQWALLTILPLEGALRFQAAGALGVWGAIAPAYVLRGVYASRVHAVPLDEGTIAYRLGLLLVIALFAGVSARELDLQRHALARLADAQQRLAALLEPAEILGALCRESVTCLEARTATVYVEDGQTFQPVAAWPSEALPNLVAVEYRASDTTRQIRVALHWRQKPPHVLVVRGGRTAPDGLAIGIASSLAESAAAALATTDILAAEQRAIHRLRSLDALRRRFVATVAHDLRLPLTVFKGVSTLLRNRREDIAPEEIDEMLHSIERQANRLSRLADDLLDGARLEVDTFTLQPVPCDVRAVIAGVVADMDEEVSVAVSGELRIVADPARLDRVLWNLLNNAEKHGKPPFEVRAWHDDASAYVEVRDHGSGLVPRQRARVFEAFTTSDETRGVGLGLAIVWQLVSAHGGTVRYEDAEPGASFTVVLPVEGPPGVQLERTTD